ncbi:MAG: zinc ribbon domain-containing protein [Clostridia bacterium]|nr:zinc ribbon domain-containing protein [Clostridia bacterium]
MFCKFCGRQIADDSKFCGFCGELVQNKYNQPIAEQPLEPIEGIGAPIQKEEEEFITVPIFAEEAPSAQPEPMEEELPPEDPAPTRVVATPAPQPTPEPEPEPIQEELPPKKKKIHPGLLWGLIGGGVGLVALLILILALVLHKPATKVDVTQYIDFKISGYDGYGVATCELDTDALERAALGEYPTGNDSKVRAKQIEYKEDAAVLKSAVTLVFDKRQGLSVGDELTAEVKVNRAVEKELNIVFSTNLTKKYTVTDKDLGGSVKIDVLAEFFGMEFEGFDGQAVAKIVTAEREEPYVFTVQDGTEYTVEPVVETGTGKLMLKLRSDGQAVEAITLDVALSASEKIKNGDEVTLTLAENSTEKLMNYGLELAGRELSVKVEGLDTFVTDLGQLKANVLTDWQRSYTASLEKYIYANWNELVHGGNTLATTTTLVENLKCTRQVVAYSDRSNALFFIFTADLSDEAIMIDNYGQPRQHYFAVRIENLILDGEGNLLTDQVKLPGDDGEGYFGAYTQETDLYAKTLDLYESVSQE